MTIPAAGPQRLLSRADFGGGFQWGCATSAYQVEGGVTEGGRVPSIWDTFCGLPGAIRDGSDGSVACDHFHRWPEDLALARSMGLNAYRFSIAWPRIFSARGSAPNEAGLAFYSRLVDGLLERGITPWVTLYHWDLPQFLQDAGGWAKRDTASAFAWYAEVAARRLGDRVQHWITHNEPWCTAILGHLDGIHAPGIKSLPTAMQVSHNLLLSHGLAVQAIRDNVPGSQVGIALNLHPVLAASGSAADHAAADRHDAFRNRWFLDPLYGRGYPAGLLRLLGAAAPTVLAGDMATIAAPTDFLGVNFYFPETVRNEPGAGFPHTAAVPPQGRERTDFGWEVAPEALTDLLVRIDRDYGPRRLYVTENGACYDDRVGADGSIADTKRRDYLARHVAALHAARSKGVPVEGYFAWSLLDNFEWSEGYLRRFGLAYTDFATQKRTLKLSGQWYRDFLR